MEIAVKIWSNSFIKLLQMEKWVRVFLLKKILQLLIRLWICLSLRWGWVKACLTQ